MSAVVHPRLPARRSTIRARTWWGKAWVRAVEETAYAGEDLARARSLARSGRVGSIVVDRGRFVAAVEGEGGLWSVAGSVAVLPAGAVEALAETVAAQAGRVTALLAGELPHSLVEHAEEAGVELLPYGGELGSACSCEPWTDPCAHALAVMYQLTWLLEADPLVLLHLRGLPREELLARLHARGGAGATPADDGLETDLDLAAEAAVRAARELAALGPVGLTPPGPPSPSR